MLSTIQDAAREAGAYFETATRDDGTEFVRTKDGTPQWVTNLVHEAHGEFLPDDWRYEVIRDALDWIEEADDPEDGSGEFADQTVDVYNSARLAWLASNLNRASYCDEAAAEFGGEERVSIFDQIGQGQYMEASEVYSLVLRALESAEGGA
jgi:hypothetical protein